MNLKGPYETNITVHITDGEREGKIDISLSMGEPPTQKMIDECLARAKETAEENGLRLMNKSEFFHVMMRERTGDTTRFAIPGGDEWDESNKPDEERPAWRNS